MKHIFVSPHMDDVVLSCGGLINKLSVLGAPQCYILNIFSGSPSLGKLSELAEQYLKEDLNKEFVSSHDAVNLNKIRINEDKSSLKGLGVNLRNIYYFQLLDAIFRSNYYKNFFYDSEEKLFGEINSNDLLILDSIDNEFKKIKIDKSIDILYFPLGIGNHVDHQLLYLYSEKLLNQNYNIVYYEDFPYNIDFYNINKRLKNINFPMKSFEVDIKRSLDSKNKAILKYSSQIVGLFNSIDNMWIILDSFNKKRNFKEKFWAKQGGIDLLEMLS